MEKCETVFIERLVRLIAARAYEKRVPLLAGLAAGFLAYTYAFTNKLLNADEITSLYAKGASVSSGRWGLVATEYIFPNFSMPWIYGALCVLILSVSAALLVHICQIRSPLLQGLVSAVIVCFPAETGTLCYMFTSAPYALAFLLSVLSVWAICRDWPKKLPSWQNLLFSTICLTMSLGIYQAYIALTASMFILLMIKALLDGEKSAKDVLLFGIVCVAFMIVSLLLYGAISTLCISLAGGDDVNDYAFSEDSLLWRVRLAYTAFAGVFIKGRFGYVNSTVSYVAHWASLLLTAAAILCWLKKVGNAAKAALLLLCLLLFPLSVCCVYLLSSTEVIHSLVVYSFVSVYLLAAVAAEHIPLRWTGFYKNVLLVSLALVAASNIYFANIVFLKMYLQYEHAYFFYSNIAMQMTRTASFDENPKLFISGSQKDMLYQFPEEIDTGDLRGPEESLINQYGRYLFIQQYLGFNIDFATWNERRSLAQDPRIADMPAYPAEGYIQNIDGFIVVKLSD